MMIKSLLITLTGLLLSTHAFANADIACGKNNATKCALSLQSPSFGTLTCPNNTSTITEMRDFIITNSTSGTIKINSNLFNTPHPSTGISVAITSGCSTSVPPGSCPIEITITVDCSKAPSETLIDAELIIEPDINQGDLTGDIQLTVSNPTMPVVHANVAVAAGSDTNFGYFAFVDHNGIWDFIETTASTHYHAATCDGAGNTATCFVGGNDSHPKPSMWSTTDGGDTWNAVTHLPGNATSTNIKGLTCTDNATLCAAIVQGGGDDIWKTTNKANSWHQVLAHNSANTLNAIDCDGAFCASGGKHNSSQLFAWNFNGLASNFNTHQGLTGEVKAVACTTSICFYAGHKTVSSVTSPDLHYMDSLVSLPTAITLTGIPSGKTSIDAIGCTTVNSKVHCLAGGQGVLYRNNNAYVNPTSWNVNPNTNINTIHSISCAPRVGITPHKAGCVVAGQNSSGHATLLIRSSTSTSVHFNSGIFNSVSCKPTTITNPDDDVFCIAAGTSTTGVPLIYVNPNIFANPTAWTSAPSAVIPASGQLNAAGASSLN
jgi:hypothetical protein